jgi:DNA/RNA-binding domain of Phe-tRNA-synthetase-like protein
MMTPPKITNRVSDRLSLGINMFPGISVKDGAALRAYIEKEIPLIVEHHRREMPLGFSFSRKLYRGFSIDPTKYRPSSEALWRRMNKGLEFPVVNPFVDLTNFLSLMSQVPYGLYDMDRIQGDIEAAQGTEGDEYEGIRKDTVTLNGKILLRDEQGPFGNPSSDSLRTSTSEQSTNVLQIIFFHPEDPLKEKILSDSFNLFSEFFNIT